MSSGISQSAFLSVLRRQKVIKKKGKDRIKDKKMKIKMEKNGNEESNVKSNEGYK